MTSENTSRPWAGAAVLLLIVFAATYAGLDRTERRLKERIASAGPARKTDGGSRLFRFDVPPIAGLQYVSAVVYLSPTGRWQDRTAAAHTKLMPVRSAAEAGGSPGLKRTSAYRSTTAEEDRAIGSGREAAGLGPRAAAPAERGRSGWSSRPSSR